MSDVPPPTPRHRPSTARKAFHTAWPLATVAALSLAAANQTTTPPAAPPTAAPAGPSATSSGSQPAPVPLLATGRPVDWWFSYKFSSSSFPSEDNDPSRSCPFGGEAQHDDFDFSQKYVVASSANATLTDGAGLIGASAADPLGATFGEIFNGAYYFVVWNDQFYNDPPRQGRACDPKQCGSPWGHSKGILAWDASGAGVVVQVTTPSWPGSGTNRFPRKAGNTLGCISNDNDVSNAQDFFSLRLNRDDVKAVLHGLAVASVSTDINNPQLVNRLVNGLPSPPDLDQLVGALGQVSGDKAFVDQPLSSGVRFLVKPSALHVPPWQFVSSRLGSEPLLTATWWASPRIPSTRSGADVHCWDPSLPTPPGEVDVATASDWEGTSVALTGAPNHAKVGVSLANGHHYAVFGDLNQQGQLGNAGGTADCSSSQNGRGGMFFVLNNPTLASGLTSLLKGTKGTIAPYAS